MKSDIRRIIPLGFHRPIALWDIQLKTHINELFSEILSVFNRFDTTEKCDEMPVARDDKDD